MGGLFVEYLGFTARVKILYRQAFLRCLCEESGLAVGAIMQCVYKLKLLCCTLMKSVILVYKLRGSTLRSLAFTEERKRSISIAFGSLGSLLAFSWCTRDLAIHQGMC